MSIREAGPVSSGPALLDGGAAVGMLTVVNRLASADFAGRRVGTPGGRAAAAWLARQMTGLGAHVRMDQFTVSGVVKELSATPMLRWRNELGGWNLVHRRDFAEHLASAAVPAMGTGHLVVAGRGDLHGAWVLAQTVDTAQIQDLTATGAIGVLVPRGTDEAGWMPKMIAGPAACPLPILSVRADLHQRMADSLHSGQSVVSSSVPLHAVDVIGVNVYGVFRPSTAGGLSVLLTAHFDGVGDDPQARFPAAADNASGVAVILQAAQRLHHLLSPGVGLTVALLDGEEAGAHGSAHHAPQVAAGTMVINVDGAAQLHEAAAVEAGGPAHALLAALDRAGRVTGVPLRAQAMPSDNRRYGAVGLAAIGIGMGMPGYQTPAETPNRVEESTLVAAVNLVTSTVTGLAGAS